MGFFLSSSRWTTYTLSFPLLTHTHSLNSLYLTNTHTHTSEGEGARKKENPNSHQRGKKNHWQLIAFANNSSVSAHPFIFHGVSINTEALVLLNYKLLVTLKRTLKRNKQIDIMSLYWILALTVTLLQCLSAYPRPADRSRVIFHEININIDRLKKNGCVSLLLATFSSLYLIFLFYSLHINSDTF